MKRIIRHIPSILLGSLFVVFGLNFFLKFIPIPETESEIAQQFMGALYISGFLKVIKILEIVGGVLIFIPKTRRIGLTILTPIIVNVLFYNQLIAKESLFQPPILIMAILIVVLFYQERRSIFSFLFKD